jgi:lysophospholipase L1-like esterase
MTLDDVVIPSLATQTFQTYRPDTFWSCYNRWHYLRYPHRITYQFNSRGFRDQEWPQDLKNAIWCLGDSVTVGLGAPFEHTWPQQLQHITQQRTINLGIRGTNNATMAHLAHTVLQEVAPKNMVIVWSIFERRPLDSAHLLDDSYSQQLIAPEIEHIRHFEQCLSLTRSNTTNVVHAFVPHYFSLPPNAIHRIWEDLRGPSWPDAPRNSSDIPQFVMQELEELNAREAVETALYFDQVLRSIANNLGEIIPRDLARDGTHFDIITAQDLAHQITRHLI